MLGWKIFLHSVRMVLGNLKQVLQITIGPALIATVTLIALVFLFGVPAGVFDVNAANSDGEMGAAPFLLALSAMAVAFAVMCWVAVSWHRFILLEEYPAGFLPEFRTDRILAYFGRILLLGVVWIACATPVLLVVSGLLQSLSILGFPLALAVIVLLGVCFLRLSIILPAAAIGRPITLSEAWQSTTGTAWPILGLVIVMTLFQLAVQIVFMALAFVPVLGDIFVVFASLLVLPIINVSMLTTLYGVFVEKRELS